MNDDFIIENISIEAFPHLEIGYKFMFKGQLVQVQRMSKNGNGFWYFDVNTFEQGYMSFEYYMETPSAYGRKLHLRR